MEDLNLPEPIADYFDADSKDGATVARCFTKNGIVLDEGKKHSGHAAIAEWKTAASAKYTYTVKPYTLDKHGREYVVTSHVSGNFPGSPVDLRYTFTLERGQIATLEIAL